LAINVLASFSLAILILRCAKKCSIFSTVCGFKKFEKLTTGGWQINSSGKPL